MYKQLLYKKILAAVLLSMLAFIARAQSPLEQIKAKQAIILNKFRYTDGTQGFNKVLASDAQGNAFWRDPLKDSFAIEDFFYVQHTTGIPDSLKLIKDLPRRFWATPSTGTDSARASYRAITLADLPPGIGGAAGLDSMYISSDSLYQIFIYNSGRRDSVNYSGNGGSGGGVSELWTQSGTNVYRPSGYVGINTQSPTARLTIKSNIDWNVTPEDSSGIVLDNGNDTTHAKSYSTLPLVFNTKNYNLFRARVYPVSIRFRGQGISSTGYVGPELLIESKEDSTNTYRTVAKIGSDGQYIVGASTVQNGAISTNNVTTSVLGTALSTVTAKESIGSNVYDTSNSCYVQINGFQRAFILPRLTQAQRNLIETVVTSITVTAGGSSYSVAPLVNCNSGVVLSAPTLTASISGGSVTSIAVVGWGRFYGAPPVTIVTPIGETGSGATATAVTRQDIKPGTKIFCTDCTANNGVTGVEQVYAGGQWNNTY